MAVGLLESLLCEAKEPTLRVDAPGTGGAALGEAEERQKLDGISSHMMELT